MKAFTSKHVLFDLDGTLVDTRNAVTECYRHVFRNKLGQDFPPVDLQVGDIFAMRPAEIFAIIAPERIDELHAAYRETYPHCTGFIKVFPGIRDLMLALTRDGRKPSVVTNKGLERTLIDLDVAGIPPSTFAAIVTAEDTVERKPHPAPILLGLKRAHAEASDAVYVGDGPQDILAARAAGMGIVAVSYGFYEAQSLQLHQPDVIAATTGELAEALGMTSVEGALS